MISYRIKKDIKPFQERKVFSYKGDIMLCHETAFLRRGCNLFPYTLVVQL